MKALLCSLLGLASIAHFCAAEERPIEQLRQEFIEMKFGMFIHFNMATFHEREWATGYEDPASFSPDQLDCNQWADVAESAGMKYAILTTKHTGGWALWDSKWTDHDISSFGNYKDGKGDIVREFTDTFRKRGIKVGLYYCFPGDYSGMHGNPPLPAGKQNLHGLPLEAQGNYVEFMKKQLHELLTGYGPIDVLWIDQYKNRYTGKEWPEIFAYLKSLQPNCVIIANNSRNFETTDIHSYEFPYLSENNPDQALPKPANPHPAEVCDKLEPDWFWSKNDSSENIKPAAEIVRMLKLCNDRNANYLLNVSPDNTGLIPPHSVKRMKEVGEMFRKNP